LLGVTGGIAAYKAPEIVRRLRDENAQVQVVLTRSARRFVTETTLQAVSGRPVRASLWDAAAEAAMGHIELARWADTIVIAPASAHVIAQLAGGLAPDLLTTLCLASDARVLIAPSMNQAMWRHPATQDNLARLAARGIEVFGPADGAQACGDVGPGRMPEPAEIAAAVLQRGPVASLLDGVRVMLTAGPTREPIDPVRYITNRSSGRMGYALAHALRRAGAEVVLVSGPVALSAPDGIEAVAVNTAQEMYDAVHARLAGVDIFVACAAVADYQPVARSPHKLKRSDATMTLEMKPCPDVLASVAAVEGGPFTVGFAAETQDLREHALGKLERKRIDMIAANKVGDDLAFDQSTNALQVFWHGGETELPRAQKTALADSLVELIAKCFRQSRPARSAQAGRVE
jgi:phosphopantothenoylcysteine decarboxylase/phosphopantothenate--cysteine ligase